MIGLEGRLRIEECKINYSNGEEKKIDELVSTLLGSEMILHRNVDMSPLYEVFELNIARKLCYILAHMSKVQATGICDMINSGMLELASKVINNIVTDKYGFYKYIDLEELKKVAD